MLPFHPPPPLPLYPHQWHLHATLECAGGLWLQQHTVLPAARAPFMNALQQSVPVQEVNCHHLAQVGLGHKHCIVRKANELVNWPIRAKHAAESVHRRDNPKNLIQKQKV